jgi:hypothetical protein
MLGNIDVSRIIQKAERKIPPHREGMESLPGRRVVFRQIEAGRGFAEQGVQLPGGVPERQTQTLGFRPAAGTDGSPDLEWHEHLQQVAVQGLQLAADLK